MCMLFAMDTKRHIYQSKNRLVHSTTTPPLTVFFLTHDLSEDLRTVYFHHLADLCRMPTGQVVPHPRTSWNPQVTKETKKRNDQCDPAFFHQLFWKNVITFHAAVATYPTITNHVQQAATNTFQLINYRQSYWRFLSSKSFNQSALRLINFLLLCLIRAINHHQRDSSVSVFNDDNCCLRCKKATNAHKKQKPTKLWVVPGVVRGDHFQTFLLFPLDDTVHGNLLAPNLEKEEWLYR